MFIIFFYDFAWTFSVFSRSITANELGLSMLNAIIAKKAWTRRWFGTEMSMLNREKRCFAWTFLFSHPSEASWWRWGCLCPYFCCKRKRKAALACCFPHAAGRRACQEGTRAKHGARRALLTCPETRGTRGSTLHCKKDSAQIASANSNLTNKPPTGGRGF